MKGTIQSNQVTAITSTVADEEWRHRIQKERAKSLYWFVEGYNDGWDGAISRLGILQVMENRQTIISYLSGYHTALEDLRFLVNGNMDDPYCLNRGGSVAEDDEDDRDCFCGE